MLRVFTTLVSIALALTRAQIHGHQGHGHQPYHQPPPGGYHQQPESASGMAVATLICGIGAWTFLPLFGAFIGAVIGWIELNKIKAGKSPEAGRTITQVGLALSAVSILLSCGGICAFGAFYFGIFALIAGASAIG